MDWSRPKRKKRRGGGVFFSFWRRQEGRGDDSYIEKKEDVLSSTKKRRKETITIKNTRGAEVDIRTKTSPSLTEEKRGVVSEPWSLKKRGSSGQRGRRRSTVTE